MDWETVHEKPGEDPKPYPEARMRLVVGLSQMMYRHDINSDKEMDYIRYVCVPEKLSEKYHDGTPRQAIVVLSQNSINKCGR